MGAELGATTSAFPYDSAMARYLAATGWAAVVALAEMHRDLLVADAEVEAHPERVFDRVVEIDLTRLQPHVVGPHSPDRARPLAQLVAERARAHGLGVAVPLLVTPGSEQVRATVERDGQMASLRAIGATVLASASGPCIGQWKSPRPATGRAKTIVTSYNRNFPMRNDGQAATMNFIGSPEIVTALALAGRLSFNPLTDTLTGADGQSFRLEPPGAAPDVPPQGFALDRSAYVAPPVDGWGTGPGQGEPHVDATFDVRLTPACDKGGVEHEAPDVVIDPGSERLRAQRLHGRARSGAQRPHRRVWPGDRRRRPAVPGARASLGGRR